MPSAENDTLLEEPTRGSFPNRNETTKKRSPNMWRMRAPLPPGEKL
jgi:hypothetical protein